jgi:predicted RNA-binding Zn-ribbon protein involved in translation (DUF1610 family)
MSETSEEVKKICTKCKKTQTLDQFKLFISGKCGKRCDRCRIRSTKYKSTGDKEALAAYNKAYYNNVLKPNRVERYAEMKPKIRLYQKRYMIAKQDAKQDAKRLGSSGPRDAKKEEEEEAPPSNQ